MVIDPNNIGNTAGVGAKAKPATDRNAVSKPVDAAAKPNTSAPDTLSLSVEAQSLTKLAASVSTAPDVDASRVESVRVAIQSGQYQIDPEAIASKMLDQDS